MLSVTLIAPRVDTDASPRQRILDLIESKRLVYPDGTTESDNAFAQRIGIVRNLLRGILYEDADIGKVAIATLFSWDPDFIEPGSEYLRQVGARLRNRQHGERRLGTSQT